ncbi:MAG: hypothetical protein AUJ98_03065 [Bacteroidetes bacterium CG2_30_33_31]|nr:MAG: hypothetical protein AUJ98_03065 [Bacteroidetes bacterium CG2_30_33_31]
MKYTLDHLDSLNLNDFLINSAKEYSNRPVLGFVGEKPMTYSEFYDEVNKLTYHLHEHGVKKFDKVAIWSQNKPNWAVAFFSIIKLGAVAVPILPDFSIKEINNILKHSESKVLFISSALYRKIDKETIDAVATIILLKDFTMRISTDEGLEKGDQFEAFCKEHSKDISQFQNELVCPDDLASIIYTSGTTGSSKGVMLTHKNLVANTIQAKAMFDVRPEYRLVSVLPMSHTFEFTLGTLLVIMSGASNYYLEKPPTAQVLLPALKSIRPQVMLTVPLIIEKIYKSKIRPELTGTPVKAFIYNRIPPLRRLMNLIAGKKLMATFGGEMIFFGVGGAKLDAETEKFLKEAHFPYAIGYGLTETSPLLAGTDANGTVLGTIGPCALGVDLKIINLDKETGLGEIVVKGPNIMKGYYKNDEKTAEVFTHDGYFKTGDTGAFDKKGNLFVKGRIKTMILGASGENIYPEEIEAQINRSDWVLESLVSQVKGQLVARIHINYEVADKYWQDVKDSASKAEKNMEQFLNDFKNNINKELNRFSKISSIIEQKDEFIKTPTKKIKRFLYEEEDEKNK